MRLYLHVLFTYGFMFTLYGSGKTALDSYFCTGPQNTAFNSNFCPVNSSSANGCVKTAWDSNICTVVEGPGTLCVNHTLNPTLCRDEAHLQVIGEPIDENKPLEYPLPASENTLYLVGYSEELKKPEYPCVASSFSRFGGGFIHRFLLLKKSKTKGQWDEEIPIQLQAKLCSIRMNLTVTCELAKKTGAQRQYLIFYQTWDSMVLTELIQQVEKPLLCSLWAKYDYIQHVEKSTLSYFYGVCQNPTYCGYPSECPKVDK
ncbi:japanin-like-RA2 isoform X2 [Rhipicephalus microplus]|uniref:japanin-like-RA2 isoform X2 n=1 Tax=Rhipicephalus microplus TaxID=6941 RepID=UPI003F6BF625